MGPLASPLDQRLAGAGLPSAAQLLSFLHSHGGTDCGSIRKSICPSRASGPAELNDLNSRPTPGSIGRQGRPSLTNPVESCRAGLWSWADAKSCRSDLPASLKDRIVILEDKLSRPCN